MGQLEQKDIVIEADIAADVNIEMPVGSPAIEGIPSGVKSYLQGTNGIMEVTATRVDATHVTIDEAAYIDNILKLAYTPVVDEISVFRP